MTNAVPSEQEPLFDRWPYNASTSIISRDLAAAIRKWALSTIGERELNSLSQRRALLAYIDGHIVPTLNRVLQRQRTPEESEAAAKEALDRGELFGIPLDRRARLEKACPREQDRRAAIEYIADQPTAQEAAKRVLDGTWVRE
jgi:hypothetical protein